MLVIVIGISLPRRQAENRNMVFPEQRGPVACYRHEKTDPLKAFSEACRRELISMLTQV